MNDNKNNMLKLYVSPEGNDAWSGRLPEPNAKRTDGPLKTLAGFQSLLRLMKAGRSYHPRDQRQTSECLSAPVIVYLRKGVYAMRSPLILSAEDSWPVTFKPYRNEKPVISGGERITGWKETTINRKTAWVVDLPEVAEGKWYFRQLFVNGRRAERPRLPKKGLFRMKEVPGMKLPAGWGGGGQTRFAAPVTSF